MSIRSNYTIDQIGISSFCLALGHPARVAIIKKIANEESCIENGVVDIDVLAPYTINRHLQGLKKAGLIKGTVSTKGYGYCVNWDKLDEFKELFDNLHKEVKQHKKKVIENNGKCIR